MHIKKHKFSKHKIKFTFLVFPVFIGHFLSFTQSYSSWSGQAESVLENQDQSKGTWRCVFDGCGYFVN